MADPIPPPPDASPAGVVRIWGNPCMAGVVGRWASLFRLRHPGIQVETALTGSDVAMAGLYTGQADIALLGREATEMERKAFEWIFRYPLLQFEIMTGSAGAAGQSPAIAVFVHASNPLETISMEQLAAVFGHEGSTIISWDGLGLEGDWTGRAINLYAPDAESGTGRYFRHRVLDDSNKMAWERLREFAEPAVHVSHVDLAGRMITAALGDDPAGMALANLDSATPAVKVLAVSLQGGPAIRPSQETVGSRRYPLARGVYAYVNRPSGGQVDAETAAFLELVLSTEGQAAVAASGDYLPLPASAAMNQAARLR